MLREHCPFLVRSNTIITQELSTLGTVTGSIAFTTVLTQRALPLNFSQFLVNLNEIVNVESIGEATDTIVGHINFCATNWTINNVAIPFLFLWQFLQA